jgi:glycosyl transferase family 87
VKAEARRCALALAVALPLFLIGCTFGVGGLAKDEWHGDVGHYHYLGERVLDGDVPYHDFYVEYPPGALPAFVVPAAISEAHYVNTFKWLMALVGSLTLIAAAVLLCVLRADTLRLATGLGAIAISPPLLGHVYLNRYDPWPALLVTLALLLLTVRRARPAFAFLALAIAAKVYAVAALPVAAIRVWRAEGRRRLEQAALTFVIVLAVVVLPFAIVAFGGLGFSFYTQSTRPLQVESLGASILLAADSVGVYDMHLIGGKANSIDLDGTLPTLVGVVSSLAVIAAVLAVAWTYFRGRDERERLVTAFAAGIAGYLVFFKVFSPQYMTWLIALVPLVAGRRGRIATLLFLGALLLTQIEIYGFDTVHGIPDTHIVYGEPQAWVPWVLLGRNLLLVAVFFLLLAELRSGGVSRALPVPRGPAARAARPAARG